MTQPTLRVVNPDATDEEVAAILAAVSSLQATAAAPAAPDESLHEWVRSARLSARRSGLQRGPWRLSGRIGRRNRA
ncbi:MAG: acyl-CoA carboxylase subunit epsilon [Actinobacteria bacterium]|nr:acyl-CoA carboxylase subunit epsilon [Actinomycetota bacterium]